MLLRPSYFIGLQVILVVNIAQCFVLLTANIEDVKKIARKFVSEPVANQIAQFIAKASGQTITLPKGISEENSVISEDEESAVEAAQYHTNVRQKTHGLPKQRYKKQTRPTTPEAVKIEYVVDPFQGDDNAIDSDANKFSLDANLNQPAYKAKKIIKVKKAVNYNTVYKAPRAEAHSYSERNGPGLIKRPLRPKTLRKPVVKIKTTTQADYIEEDNQNELDDAAEAYGYDQDVQYEVTIQPQRPKPMRIKLRQNKAQSLKPGMKRKPLQKMTTKNNLYKNVDYDDQEEENQQEYQDEEVDNDNKNKAIKGPVRSNQINKGNNMNQHWPTQNKGNQGNKQKINKNNVINDADNENKNKGQISDNKINKNYNGKLIGKVDPYNEVSYWVNLGSENKGQAQGETAKQNSKLRPNKLLEFENKGVPATANQNNRPKQGFGNNQGNGQGRLNQANRVDPNQASNRGPNQGPIRGAMEGPNQRPNQGGQPEINQGGLQNTGRNKNQGGRPNMNQGGIQNTGRNQNQGSRPNMNLEGIQNTGRNQNQGGRPNMNQEGIQNTGRNQNQGGRPNMNQGGIQNTGKNQNQGGRPNMNQGSIQNMNIGRNQNQVRQQNQFGNNQNPRQVQRFTALRTTARDRMGSSEWMPGARSVIPYRKPTTQGRFALLHADTTAPQNDVTETTADKQDRGEDDNNNDQQEANDNNEDQTNNLEERKDEADTANPIEPNDPQANDDDANTNPPEDNLDDNDSLNNQDNLVQQEEFPQNDIKDEDKSQEPEDNAVKENPYLQDTEDPNPTEATTMTLLIENFANGIDPSNIENRAMEISTRKEERNEFDQYDLPRAHSTTEQADLTKEDLEPRAQIHEGRIKPSRLLPDEDLQITFQKVPKAEVDKEDTVMHKQGLVTIDTQFINVTSTEATSVVKNNRVGENDGKKTQIILKL